MTNIIPLPRITVTHFSDFTKETPEKWQDEALCAEIGSDLFFIDGKGWDTSYKEARSICRKCTVREDCLEYIMRIEGSTERRYRHGLWAELDPRQRTELAQERGLLIEESAESQELHVL